jgi:ABC-type glycerol-3-phosphate transport system permease component
VNSYTGLIIAYVAITLPFCVYMMIGYFQTVSISLDEAARIDGCSTLGIIFRVVLPVAWPGIVATAVYAFVRSWEEYLFALTLMTDDSQKTVPTMIFFLIMQKQLVSGLAAGAVKQ